MTRSVSAAILLATALFFSCRREAEHSTANPPRSVNLIPWPKPSEVRNGSVEDEAAAIKIAVGAWVPIYGTELIEGEKPYRAELKNGIWTVQGSLLQGIEVLKKMNLAIGLEQEDDGRWIAETDELSCVLVYGATREEAIKNVKPIALRVIADRLENGESLPHQARSLDFEAA